MNYYFFLAMFTMGELWAIIVIFGVFVLALCGVGHFFCLFFAKQQSSNKLFLGDLPALRRAYKNYQLLLICWLAGYWSPDAGWFG